jgi:hypothetical protein
VFASALLALLKVQSVRVFLFEDDEHGLHENLKIHPQRPLADVAVVEFDAALHFFQRLGFAAGDLRTVEGLGSLGPDEPIGRAGLPEQEIRLTAENGALDPSRSLRATSFAVVSLGCCRNRGIAAARTDKICKLRPPELRTAILLIEHLPVHTTAAVQRPALVSPPSSAASQVWCVGTSGVDAANCAICSRRARVSPPVESAGRNPGGTPRRFHRRQQIARETLRRRSQGIKS